MPYALTFYGPYLDGQRRPRARVGRPDRGKRAKVKAGRKAARRR